MAKKVLIISTSLRGGSNSDIKASLKGMVGGGGIDAANTAADYVKPHSFILTLQLRQKKKLYSLCRNLPDKK